MCVNLSTIVFNCVWYPRGIYINVLVPIMSMLLKYFILVYLIQVLIYLSIILNIVFVKVCHMNPIWQILQVCCGNLRKKKINIIVITIRIIISIFSYLLKILHHHPTLRLIIVDILWILGSISNIWSKLKS